MGLALTQRLVLAAEPLNRRNEFIDTFFEFFDIQMSLQFNPQLNLLLNIERAADPVNGMYHDTRHAILKTRFCTHIAALFNDNPLRTT